MDYYIPLYARRNSARHRRCKAVKRIAIPAAKAIGIIAAVIVPVQAAAQIVALLWG